MTGHHISRPNDHGHLPRRLTKTIIVTQTLWGIIPATWACKLLEGFRHD